MKNTISVVYFSENKGEENVKSTEHASATMQNEKSSNDHKVTCSVKNASSEAVLPPTDAK